MGEPENPRAAIILNYQAEAEKYWTLQDDEDNVDDDYYQTYLEPQREVLIGLLPAVREAFTELGLNTWDNVRIADSIHVKGRDLLVGVYANDRTPRRAIKDRLVYAVAHAKLPSSTRKAIAVAGRKVVICHGRSKEWYVLKDFLTNELKLDVDEFNSVPVAGLSTKERLLQLKTTAGFAFVVLTAEDRVEDADGEGHHRARENVVHEAGFFQSHLGFEKAIVLLEHGCKEFSNIAGIQQIRFPKDDIRPAFDEIRRVLVREHVLKPG
jgi:predicted nucleotide-binding protein